MAMTSAKLLPLAAAAALALAACEARFGNDATHSGGSAEGKSKEGEFSVSTNGFEMKVQIPEGLQREADIRDDSGVIYPSSRMSGMHVQGGDGGGSGRDEVEIRFTTADAPETVERWYRDPARAADFTVASAAREGDAFVLSGTRKDDNGAFRLRLTPRQGGGTDGRAVLSDAN
jgi:hypothetical protein